MINQQEVNEVRLNAFFDTLLAEVTSSPSVEANARDRLVARARKKARFVDPGLSTKAINDFLADNDRMRDFKISLDRDIVDNARHFITVMMERFTSSIDPSLIQETLDPTFLFNNWRFGPGASHEVTGTHTADKIQQNMTCTSSCEPFVSALRRTNPYFQGFDSRNGNDGMSRVRGSELTTVPKNQDTERTIAIEPSGNMALQLAAGAYLEGVLRYIGLDIRCQQPINRALAHRGSIDGSIATVDLKSASNMHLIDLVRLLYPKRWFAFLMAVRSPEIKLPNGEWVKLHMMSTMGNGFTFPLMTLSLIALIYGYRCRTATNPTLYVDWSQTAVFGDDIIIPVSEYELAVETLEHAGFVVNLDKSYSEGPFRESCGGDYFAGVDVSPFYCKSLATDAEVFTVINQVLDWSVRTNCFLPATLNLLGSFLKGKAHLVPEWMNPDQGILTQACNRRYSYLALDSERVVLKADNYFSLPLACGGYISTQELSRTHCVPLKKDSLGMDIVEPSGADMVYLPRAFRTRYKVRHARLPKGFLDGWDPRKRSQLDSSKVSLYLQLTIAGTAS